MRTLKTLFLTFTFLYFHQACANIEKYFNSIKANPNALYAFFKEMPKGGELHYHLAGGAYPEAMLSLAATQDYCLNKETFVITKNDEKCIGLNSTEIFSHPEIYNSVIRAWSMKDFFPGKESSHDHFFATFFKFMPIIADFRPQLLAEILTRAAEQHEIYMEIMILPDNARSTSFAKLIKDTPQFTDKHKILLANREFQDNIAFTRKEAERILTQAHHELGCEQNPQPPACKVTVKFQYYILREQPIENVFAQAVNAFAAASQSNIFVGINLVQAEDGLISLRDYREQMKIMEFLHTSYPKVNIALHAGEMAPSDVAPKELRFHIHDAIFTGHAQRIGHGVDIAYENDADKILKHMAITPVPAEINLISNREILNISGAEHPLHTYLAYKVPVVLSTDDEGILRTDLTRQYVDAAYTQGLDYPTLRAINRNALTYSFLRGASLWKEPSQQLRVADCNDLESKTCEDFVNKSEKAKLQRTLELQLLDFEKNYLFNSSLRHPVVKP